MRQEIATLGFRSMSTRTLKKLASLCLILGCTAVATVKGQEASTSSSVVPRLVQFSSIVTDSAGKPPGETATVTFSLYELQDGGTPLWSETQSLALDSQGHYTAFLGAASPDGLPLDLFSNGSARWLGIAPQLPSVGELPRVLLVGVPYALKAADADTLGGKPASAFVTVDNQSSAASGAGAGLTAFGSNGLAVLPLPAAPLTVGGSGTTNFIPIWTNSTMLGNSTIFQSTAGNVGIGTATPAGKLDVKGGAFVRGTLQLPSTGNATATKGINSQAFDLLGSAFNSTIGQAVSQHFRWQAEPVGNNTSSPLGSLNLLFGEGAVTPAEIGFSILGNGLVTIGATTNLGAALDVHGNEFISGGLSLDSSGSQLGFNRNVSTGQIYDNTHFAYQTGQVNSDDSFQIQQYLPSGVGTGAPIYIQSTGDVDLVFSSVGKVGIKTENPSNILTIAQGAGAALSDGWSVYSSRRWKTNIRPIEGALGKVEQLRGVSYDLKANGKHEIGVIAEEVGQVIPEVVDWDKNGKDANGVDYSRLTVLLIEATKQQQREIHAQQALLRAQAATVRELKAEVRATRESLRHVKAQLVPSQPTLVAVK